MGVIAYQFIVLYELGFAAWHYGLTAAFVMFLTFWLLRPFV